MINFNGVLTDKSDFITPSNRALLYGDAVFETFKVVDNKILFGRSLFPFDVFYEDFEDENSNEFYIRISRRTNYFLNLEVEYC